MAQSRVFFGRLVICGLLLLYSTLHGTVREVGKRVLARGYYRALREINKEILPSYDLINSDKGEGGGGQKGALSLPTDFFFVFSFFRFFLGNRREIPELIREDRRLKESRSDFLIKKFSPPQGSSLLSLCEIDQMMNLSL